MDEGSRRDLFGNNVTGVNLKGNEVSIISQNKKRD